MVEELITTASAQRKRQAAACDSQTRTFQGVWAMFGENFCMLEPRPRLAPWDQSKAEGYKATAAAAARVHAGMGPLMLLGAIECDDVNHALLGLLGVKRNGLLVQGLQGQKELWELCPTTPVLELSDIKLVQQFRLQPGDVDTRHPQRPLVFQHLRNKFNGVLEMDGLGPRGGDGFVGMATNLIHMPAPLQNLRVGVHVRGNLGGSSQPSYFALRQTLWHALFHETMVFEGKEDLEAFLRRCKDARIPVDQKIITLCGVRHNILAQAWSLPGQALHSGELLMANVPISEQEVAPLDLRLVRAKESKKNVQAQIQDGGCEREQDTVHQLSIVLKQIAELQAAKAVYDTNVQLNLDAMFQDAVRLQGDVTLRQLQSN